jgi:hypothetical protein
MAHPRGRSLRDGRYFPARYTQAVRISARQRQSAMALDIDDLIIAVFIAFVIIIALACARYGIRGSDIDGYWGTFGGDQYRIRAYKGGNLTVMGPHYAARGVMRPLRGVCVGDGEKTMCGSVALDGRWLNWNNGQTWIRQGLIKKKGGASNRPDVS